MYEVTSLPHISIVVPSLNQAAFLGEALESIFRQNFPHLEVVVMDGGSTDNSVQVIRSFAPRLKYWQSRQDAGQAAAINTGMQHCTGELVGWLNADDFYWGDALWTVGQAYAALPQRGLYIGNGYVLRDGTYRRSCNGMLAFNRDALTHGLDYILQPATFFLRSAWNAVGGLDPALQFCMDWDIILRIAARYPATLINDFLAVNREHAATKTRRGKLERAMEIVRTAQVHSGQKLTLGSLFYLLETLVDLIDNSASDIREHLAEALFAVRRNLALAYGSDDGFPQRGDPQDHRYDPPQPSSPPPTLGESAGTIRASLHAHGEAWWNSGVAAFRRREFGRAAWWAALAAASYPPLVWSRCRAPLLHFLRRLPFWLSRYAPPGRTASSAREERGGTRRP